MSAEVASQQTGGLPRLVGLDLFRAVAVFGMLVAHVGPAAWTAGAGFGTVHWEWEIFHSRMPAMFAFAAGLSLNLGRARTATGVQPEVVPTIIRAALLAGCGFGLSALGTPVAVILGYFAVWFVLVLPFRRCRVRTLLLVTGVWALAGPALSFVLRQAMPGRGSLIWNALVTGDYPALTWMPFVLAGLAVGRLDLTAARVRTWLGVCGAALMAVGYAVSSLLLALGGAGRIMHSLQATPELDQAQQFARIFFRERGFTDPGSWWWLVAPAPHSGSWGDLLGCLGVCGVLLAVLLPLGDLAHRAAAGFGARGAGARVLLRGIAPLGAMVLSVYAAHIVVMAAVTLTTGHSFAGPQSVWTLAGFTLGLLLFAWAWLRRFSRGPLEWLLGRASSAIERTGRRVFAGSWRR